VHTTGTAGGYDYRREKTMRKLMWFTVGFTIACVLGAYFLTGTEFAIPTILSVLVGFFCFLNRKKHIRYAIINAISLGCLVGILWIFLFDSYYIGAARDYDGTKQPHSVEITDYSECTSYGIAANGKLTLNNGSYKVKVYLPYFRELKPGDCVKGQMRLRLTAEGGDNAPTYHRGNGIFLLVYADEETTVYPADKIPVKYFTSVMRRNILETIDAVFPEDTLAFARALLLGDTSKLTYETDTSFKLSGIRHVIAVSGLHVSILFSLAYLAVGKRRVLTAVIGIPVLILFAAIAGFTPSILRACLMQMLMIIALLLKKEYDPPTALSFAVLVMLVCNPLAITSVSLQLSAGCMIGIFLFSGRINKALLKDRGKGKGLKAKLYRWITGSFSVTISAMLTTTPLSAYYFGTISLVGILTNLATLWIISFVFYGIMVACVAGAIWLPLGKGIAWIISWCMRYVLLVAKVLGGLPIAAVYTCSLYILLWLIFAYILIGIYLIVKKKRPLVFTGCILFSLIVCIAISWIEPRLDSYRITVLDVGQGQCILLQTKNRNYIVDCGGDSDTGAADTAAQMLGSQGISRIDGLILTHYDSDHAGGVPYLLTRIDADKLYLPTGDSQSFIECLRQEDRKNIVFVNNDMILQETEASISLFPSKNTKENAETSMGILFQIENYDILITGDMDSGGEKALLERANLPKLELMMVGHHGSNTSTSWELLEATRPKVAVISVSAENHYGHPAENVLNKLKIFGCKVYRTDTQGTIIFRG